MKADIDPAKSTLDPKKLDAVFEGQGAPGEYKDGVYKVIVGRSTKMGAHQMGKAMGVNGGYTQRDVTEVARVFTGWTIEQPKKGGGFRFEERMHEPGNKIVTHLLVICRRDRPLGFASRDI